jgi:hypothetical protein
VALYLRLNGYLSITNYLQHRIDYFGLETESDVLAMRMPYQREVLLDGSEQRNDERLILPATSRVIDCVIAEVKESAVEFNKPVRGPDGPRRIRNVLRMFGVLPDEMFEPRGTAWVMADELCQKVNERKWPDIPSASAMVKEESISVRMIVFAPQGARGTSERACFDVQAVLDFVRRRMAPGEVCSPYRGQAFSHRRGTTRLIVDVLDNVSEHPSAGLPWPAFVEQVLERSRSLSGGGA